MYESKNLVEVYSSSKPQLKRLIKNNKLIVLVSAIMSVNSFYYGTAITSTFWLGQLLFGFCNLIPDRINMKTIKAIYYVPIEDKKESDSNKKLILQTQNNDLIYTNVSELNIYEYKFKNQFYKDYDILTLNLPNGEGGSKFYTKDQSYLIEKEMKRI